MSSQQTNVEKAKIWRARIAEQQMSDLPIKRFCLERGWKIYTFMYWKPKFKKSDTRMVPSRKFVSVHASDSIQSRSRITLPNGVTVELGDDVENNCVSTLIKSLCGVNNEVT